MQTLGKNMSIALQNVTESSPPSQKEPQQTKLCQSIVKNFSFTRFRLLSPMTTVIYSLKFVIQHQSL